MITLTYQYIYEIERNKRSEYNRRLQELIENIDDDVDTNRDIFKRLQDAVQGKHRAVQRERVPAPPRAAASRRGPRRSRGPGAAPARR